MVIVGIFLMFLAIKERLAQKVRYLAPVHVIGSPSVSRDLRPDDLYKSDQWAIKAPQEDTRQHTTTPTPTLTHTLAVRMYLLAQSYTKSQCYHGESTLGVLEKAKSSSKV